MTEVEQTIEAVASAKTPLDIFLVGQSAEAIYRRLAMLIHPDRVDELLKDKANAAFVKLAKFYAQVNGKPEPFQAVKIGRWLVTAPLASGGMADLYFATSEKDDRGVFKITRLPKDNDLMEAEAASLKALWADGSADNFKKYLPQILDGFRASGRAVNIIGRGGELHYSLADILQRFPGGLDFRHVVWMGNRLLSILGYAHRVGYVHGAVVPEHLLYQIEDHGLLLVDWCYSVARGKAVKAIVPGYRRNYPGEVLLKKPADAATDMFMFAKAMVAAAKEIPRRFEALLEGWCLAESPNARPQDAWELQQRWMSLAEEEYGKPEYVRLEMPPTN